ncbi:Azobenzene reductase [Saliniradius amylolyticus]|uniref:Azobenzene reductase n=1 Tax=Saliniradius amylolyticus TaxID=2183582 RepID=A0A2S2DZ75_9ALTE|nr:NAD(P)H-dependent oxidoreductase [Saliniradius amylolyticus]AWL10715.1 Azobenzene reductase [Saliniradius amylolyticus]
MKLLLFLGTVRDSSPPRPSRLGERVAKACLDWFQHQAPEIDVTLVDALDYPAGPVFKPHFAYPRSRVPEDLDTLAIQIEAADGYIMVSPEYNHTMSPALTHLLNHFGSSLFSYKPSAIVTYSAGQWGGMRAAVGMRTFLSELGCLPVSAMVHIPEAQKVFTDSGQVQVGAEQDRWADYIGRSFKQLLWWAQATSRERQHNDPHASIKAFKRAPSERNAP